MDDQIGGKNEDPNGRWKPSLLLMPGKLTEGVSKMMFSLFVINKDKAGFKRIHFSSMGRVRNWRKSTKH